MPRILVLLIFFALLPIYELQAKESSLDSGAAAFCEGSISTLITDLETKIKLLEIERQNLFREKKNLGETLGTKLTYEQGRKFRAMEHKVTKLEEENAALRKKIDEILSEKENNEPLNEDENALLEDILDSEDHNLDTSEDTSKPTKHSEEVVFNKNKQELVLYIRKLESEIEALKKELANQENTTSMPNIPGMKCTMINK
tara:strand:+ start:170 stop:772 length:603 start_codon:yes stop_codon:yes gene_type:complete